MSDSERQMVDGTIIGLFNSMIEDIPKRKQEKHILKLEQLNKIGLVREVDLSGGCMHFHKREDGKALICVDCNMMFFDLPLNSLS